MKTSHLIPPPGWVFSERISFEDLPEEEEGGRRVGGEKFSLVTSFMFSLDELFTL